MDSPFFAEGRRLKRGIRWEVILAIASRNRSPQRQQGRTTQRHQGSDRAWITTKDNILSLAPISQFQRNSLIRNRLLRSQRAPKQIVVFVVFTCLCRQLENELCGGMEFELKNEL